MLTDYRPKVGDLRANRKMTPARRADGPSACPCDSSCGPGGVGESDNSWTVMQQAEKPIACGTQALKLRPWWLPLVCFLLHTRLRVQLSARRSARPLSGKNVRRDRRAPRRIKNRGDDT